MLKRHGLLTKRIVAKEAIVGLTKFRFLVQVVNVFSGMNFRIFNSKEETLEWLINKSN